MYYHGVTLELRKKIGLVSFDNHPGRELQRRRVAARAHCNGTHTESVGHIVGEAMPIAECLMQTLIPARVITVTPCAADATPRSIYTH